tara:strand:- start:130 stop:345 length:216 start_codon:yes stop_codon:yes gene_type:complete
MKFIDLDNINKYFSLANMPYYTDVIQLKGTLSKASGLVINNLTDEVSSFELRLDIEDNIHLSIDGFESPIL